MRMINNYKYKIILLSSFLITVGLLVSLYVLSHESNKVTVMTLAKVQNKRVKKLPVKISNYGYYDIVKEINNCKGFQIKTLEIRQTEDKTKKTLNAKLLYNGDAIALRNEMNLLCEKGIVTDIKNISICKSQEGDNYTSGIDIDFIKNK